MKTKIDAFIYRVCTVHIYVAFIKDIPSFVYILINYMVVYRISSIEPS
jgi:hypothetical protein